MEPAPGAFDFSGPDEALGAAEAAGVEVVAMLGYGNPWATSVPEATAQDDEFYPPDDPADFGRFAGAVAARYGDRLRRYEIWNEPNAGYRFWKRPGQISGDPVAYAALLGAAHDAIRAVSPAARVALGGTFLVPQFIVGGEDFVSQVAAAGAPGAAFEAVAYHPYPPYPPRVPPEARDPVGRPPFFALDESADRLHALLAASPAGDRPLWVTEYGWPDLDLSPEIVASYLLRAQLLLWARGVELACVYTIYDADPSVERPAPWEAAFGLVAYAPAPGPPDAEGRTWTEKPQARALRRLFTLAGADRLVADVPLAGGAARALLTEGPDGTRHILAWAPGAMNPPGAINAPLPEALRAAAAMAAPLAAPWEAIDLVTGDRQPLPAGLGPALALGPAPVFVAPAGSP